MSAFLPSLLGVAALIVLLLIVGTARRFWEARQARRTAMRRALARHPAQRSQLPRRTPGRPIDGDALTGEELAEFTGIMLRSTTREQGRRPQ